MPLPLVKKWTRRESAQHHYENLWKTDPTRFRTDRHARELLRVERTLTFTLSHLTQGSTLLDLGTGDGRIAMALHQQGFSIEVADISPTALKHLPSSIPCHHEFIPHTKLFDKSFDAVLALELVAELPLPDQRLLQSEIARLLKPNGLTIGSTSIDIHSEDALSRYFSLIDTEFTVLDIACSHHAYSIRFPWIQRCRSLTLALEALCRFFQPETGISHLLWVGQKKPLLP